MLPYLPLPFSSSNCPLITIFSPTFAGLTLFNNIFVLIFSTFNVVVLLLPRYFALSRYVAVMLLIPTLVNVVLYLK